MTETTRRAVLAGATAATAVVLLGACGSDDQAPPGAPAGAAPAKPHAGAAVTSVFAKTDDIPVNGGKVYSEQLVVVTQPTAGEFKAFSATCTHKGCLLSGVDAGSITCKCHGARFSVTDGSVQSGPAKDALAAKTIKVVGDSISFG